MKTFRILFGLPCHGQRTQTNAELYVNEKNELKKNIKQKNK